MADAARPRRRRVLRRGLVLVLAAGLTGGLGGCASLGYYWQSVSGHLDLMSRRQPIERLLGAPGTPPALHERLRVVEALRAFARDSLALPAGGSYRSYADLGRDNVTWTVVATPELSLEPTRWCFPVVGCVAYRGYFREADALVFANRLAAEGFDVAVTGASAYSTLGWFDDPVLNTMFGRSPFVLAGTLFHELAHRRVYLAGDSAFSEAYAVAVERAGVRRWLARHGSEAERDHYERALARRDEFLSMVGRAEADLAAVYASPRTDAGKRALKAARLARLAGDYRQMRHGRGGHAGYDHWFAHEPNNARLALVATYNEWVPAFERLLDEHGAEMAAFHAAVEELAAMPEPARIARLEALAAQP